MPHCATCDDWLVGGEGTGVNPKTAIDGVGIWEWIPKDSVYRQVTKGVDPTFYTTLVSWKQNLHTYSTTYSAGVLPSPIFSFGHYGIYACRHIGQGNNPGCDPVNDYEGSSYHSWCRAFDLTQVRWGTGTGPTSRMGIIPAGGGGLLAGDHASTSQTLRRRYLGVNAICLKYFKNTLNGWTPDHSNHIHMDNSKPVGVLDKTHMATVRFVQAACNNLNGASLDIDGLWGDLTTAAFTAANAAMCFNVDVFTSSTAWKDWCSMIAKHGFRNQALGYYKYSTVNCPL